MAAYVTCIRNFEKRAVECQGQGIEVGSYKGNQAGRLGCISYALARFWGLHRYRYGPMVVTSGDLMAWGNLHCFTSRARGYRV